MKDTMYLEGAQVLHIVCSGTNFSAARVIFSIDMKTIWTIFFMLSASIYNGYPTHIHSDQSSAFNGIEWNQLCN